MEKLQALNLGLNNGCNVAVLAYKATILKYLIIADTEVQWFSTFSSEGTLHKALTC